MQLLFGGAPAKLARTYARKHASIANLNVMLSPT